LIWRSFEDLLLEPTLTRACRQLSQTMAPATWMTASEFLGVLSQRVARARNCLSAPKKFSIVAWADPAIGRGWDRGHLAGRGQRFVLFGALATVWASYPLPRPSAELPDVLLLTTDRRPSGRGARRRQASCRLTLARRLK